MSANNLGTEDAASSRDAELEYIDARKKLIEETSDIDLGNMMTDLWNGSLQREEQEAIVIQALDFVMQRENGLDGVEAAMTSVESPTSTLPTGLPVEDDPIATKHKREETPPPTRGKRVKHQTSDEDLDEADPPKPIVKRKPRGRPPGQAKAPAPAPLPTLSSDTTIATQSTVKPLDTVIWIPKSKGNTGTLTPLSALSPDTVSALQGSFTSSYQSVDRMSRYNIWYRAVTKGSGDPTIAFRCVNNVVYIQSAYQCRYTKSNGHTNWACDTCINTKRLCVKVVKDKGDGGRLKMCVYPLPNRSGVSFDDIAYWVRG